MIVTGHNQGYKSHQEVNSSLSFDAGIVFMHKVLEKNTWWESRWSELFMRTTTIQFFQAFFDAIAM